MLFRSMRVLIPISNHSILDEHLLAYARALMKRLAFLPINLKREALCILALSITAEGHLNSDRSRLVGPSSYFLNLLVNLSLHVGNGFVDVHGGGIQATPGDVDSGGDSTLLGMWGVVCLEGRKQAVGKRPSDGKGWGCVG